MPRVSTIFDTSCAHESPGQCVNEWIQKGIAVTTCMYCDQAQGHNLMEATKRRGSAPGFDSAQACAKCELPLTLMQLSEATRLACLKEKARAKVSANWVLAILAVTCVLLLLNMHPQRAKESGFNLLSSLVKDVGAATGQ
jgi:hypothetical protein